MQEPKEAPRETPEETPKKPPRKVPFKNVFENKSLLSGIILTVVSFLVLSGIFAVVLFGSKAGSCSTEVYKKGVCTDAQAAGLALTLIKNSPTFTFDGIKDSIKLDSETSADNGKTWKLLYFFKTAHPGHGDRKGQVLAEVVTQHAAQITVTGCKIVSAVCDSTWNLLTDRSLK